MSQVPLCSPTAGPTELEAIARVFESGMISHGPEVAAFERDFADFIGVPHAVSTNSWTSGAYLALLELREDTGPGEIIVPSYTFVASANVIVNAGFTPRFADVDPLTHNVTVDSLEEARSPRTVGVMPVHFAGRPCNMAEIDAWAKLHGLFVLEDSAECLGASTGGRQAGATGIGVFSFYATKNITTGEGGMVTTHDETFASRLRLRAGHGVAKGSYSRDGVAQTYMRNAVLPGQNFRLSNMQAAMGRVQLSRLPSFNQQRYQVALEYRELLGDIEEVRLPEVLPAAAHSYQMYVIGVDPSIRDRVVFRLQEQGVGASVHFDPPVHEQTFYRDLVGTIHLPTTELLARSSITLPISATQTGSQTQHVASKLREAVQSR